MRWGAVAAKWGLVASGPLGLVPLGSAAVAAPLGSAPFGSAAVAGPLGLVPLGSADVAGPFGSVPFGSPDVAVAFGSVPLGSADGVVALGSVPLGSGPFAPGMFAAFGVPTLPSVALLIAFLGAPGAPGTTPLAPGITPLPGMVVSCFLAGTSCFGFSAAFFFGSPSIRAAGCASAPELRAPPTPIAATASSSRMATQHQGFRLALSRPGNGIAQAPVSRYHGAKLRPLCVRPGLQREPCMSTSTKTKPTRANRQS